MEMAFLKFLFLVIMINGIHGAPTNGTNLNQCWVEGEEVKLIAGWSTCHNGRYVPSACQADNGTKVDIGLTVRQRNFIFECIQTSDIPDSPVTLRPIACLRQKGKAENALVVEPGQRLKDAPFVYECLRLPSPNPNVAALALKAIACANSSSEIPDGGTVIMGNFTFTCERASGSLTDYKREVFLKAKGCVYRGKEYEINQQVVIGSYMYRCILAPSLGASQMQFTIVGCASEGRRYDPDEKFYTPRTSISANRYIMQCRHVNDTWSINPAGCVEETDPPIDHDIGDTWIVDGGPGDDRLKYIVVCRGDARLLGQIPIQCVYQPNPNDISSAKTLDPGCVRRFTKPNVLVKCAKGDDENGVSSELITKLNLNKYEQEAIDAGFRHC